MWRSWGRPLAAVWEEAGSSLSTDRRARDAPGDRLARFGAGRLPGGRQQHAVDDVDRSVARRDVGLDDLRAAVQEDALVTDADAHLAPGKRSHRAQPHDLLGLHVACDDVVQEYPPQLGGLATELPQRRLGQLREGSVRR